MSGWGHPAGDLTPLPGAPVQMKCTRCVDTLLTEGKDPAEAPAGEVMVPFTQAIQTPQGTVLLGSTILLCLGCRTKEIKAPGANGRLLRA